MIATMATVGTATPPKPPSCRQLSEGLLKNAMTPQSKVRSIDGQCLFSNMRIKTGTRQAWTVEQLTVAGLDQWDGKLSPLPPHLRVEAKGIRFSYEIDNSHARYQMALTQKPFDARLDFAFDVAAKTLSLREVALESPWLGHVSFAADAEFQGDNVRDPSDLIGLRVSRLRFVLDNRSLLESMIMPSLIAFIPDDKDPAVEFPRQQKEAERRLKKLPTSALDAESRQALIRFTRDFPHPSGHFELDLMLDRPTSLDGIAKQKKNDAWLDHARIFARYQPQVTQP
ncbi:hypothetical protein MOK15_17135 [Sphingobium sp. BYY-5]|uniref:hypothetical protein n=1 Tax=Sphingobium sp. BYY-5 TaxID=2926400 RepID=UPI001FA720F5|nr:hypothetical protein [Sphingobium sp. BYY-5]MCI4591809.1 hypothetical protein [Sphingobium sp. BYY-5]